MICEQGAVLVRLLAIVLDQRQTGNIAAFPELPLAPVDIDIKLMNWGWGREMLVAAPAKRFQIPVLPSRNLLISPKETQMVRRSVLTFFGIVIAASALSLASLSAQAADAPITGTWELNLAASSSTLPLPASQTRTYVSTGQQEKMTGTGVDAKGNAINVSFDVPCSSER